MNISPQIIWAIARKDIRGLMPLVLLTAGLLSFESIVSVIDLESSGEFFALLLPALPWLSQFTCGLLILAVFLQDPALSLSHDWLTRPIARLDLLLAKLTVLSIAIVLPLVLFRLLAHLFIGHSIIESLFQATIVETGWVLMLIPLLAGSNG